MNKLVVLVFLSLGVASALAQEVVVRPGDTLSSIAAEELGSERRWPELCELNRAVLSDCDRVRVGTTLVLEAPEVVEAEPDIPAAVNMPSANLFVNGDFATGLEAWLEEPDADVTKEWVDGELEMTRGPGLIAGAAMQSVDLEPGKYELSVTVSGNPVGYLLSNTDKIYQRLEVGEQVVEITALGGETIASFWPLGTNSTVKIGEIKLTALAD